MFIRKFFWDFWKWRKGSWVVEGKVGLQYSPNRGLSWPFWSSGARMALQSFPKLGWVGWMFITLQLVTRCGLCQVEGLTMGEVVFFSQDNLQGRLKAEAFLVILKAFFPEGIWAVPQSAHHNWASHSSTHVFWDNLLNKPLTLNPCLGVCLRRNPSQDRTFTEPLGELAMCLSLLLG